MIFKGSRYQRVQVLQTTGPDGQVVSYRNPEKFWLIADANDEMDPEDLLEPGRQLLIPPDRS